uniref:Uncharacterized protein n=1 Tax=Aegilops tauschii TaxID=37682 RepID=M8CX42_AEGTA
MGEINGLEAHNPPPPPSFAGQTSLVRHRSDILRRRTNRRRSSPPPPGLAAPLDHRRVPPPPNSAITVGTAPADELAGAHTPPATNLDEEAGVYDGSKLAHSLEPPKCHRVFNM